VLQPTLGAVLFSKYLRRKNRSLHPSRCDVKMTTGLIDLFRAPLPQSGSARESWRESSDRSRPRSTFSCRRNAWILTALSWLSYSAWKRSRSVLPAKVGCLGRAVAVSPRKLICKTCVAPMLRPTIRVARHQSKGRSRRIMTTSFRGRMPLQLRIIAKWSVE
jgi:hypothetical protein